MPAEEAAKGRFEGIRHSFSEADLENPDVAKAMFRTVVGENEEYKREVTELEVYKENFYKKREEAAVLSTQLTALRESVGIRNFFFVIAGAGIGFMFVPELIGYRVPVGLLVFVLFFLAMWNGRLPFTNRGT